MSNQCGFCRKIGELCRNPGNSTYDLIKCNVLRELCDICPKRSGEKEADNDRPLRNGAYLCRCRLIWLRMQSDIDALKTPGTAQGRNECFVAEKMENILEDENGT